MKGGALLQEGETWHTNHSRHPAFPSHLLTSDCSCIRLKQPQETVPLICVRKLRHGAVA